MTVMREIALRVISFSVQGTISDLDRQVVPVIVLIRALLKSEDYTGIVLTYLNLNTIFPSSVNVATVECHNCGPDNRYVTSVAEALRGSNSCLSRCI